MFCHDGDQRFLMDYDFFGLFAHLHATEQYTSEFRTNFIDIISVRVSPTFPPVLNSKAYLMV